VELLHLSVLCDGVVAVSGQLDCSTSDVLAKALRNSNAVRLDLSGIEFVDSAGLSVLLREQRRLGAGFAILDASCPVRRLCELADLASTLLEPAASNAAAGSRTDC
jgi:anti-anti-sigma factor